MVDAEKALFEGQVQGLIVTLYQNERPLQGLAGTLDWRFHGLITQSLLDGSITGSEGECVYFPITRHQTTYHLFFTGGGHTSTVGQRAPVPKSTFQLLQKNLKSLKLPKIALSLADFGNMKTETVSEMLKGIPLWIAP